MNRFIINGVACILVLSGTVGFTVGICGLFVGNTPAVKKQSEARAQQILDFSNMIGPAGLLCLLLGGSTIMLSNLPRKKRKTAEVIPFTTRQRNHQIAA